MQGSSIMRVRSKVDGPGGLNWTVETTEGGRFRVKVDGPKGLKVDGMRKWTVLQSKSGRSKGKILYDMK